jgi:tRNA(Ile)-lysidine synthase
VTKESAQRIRETVKWFALSEELIPTEGLAMAAVSGGPDSMALLSILHDLSGELKFHVAVAHFDHQIRAAAEREAERSLVEDFAKSLGLPFYSGTADVRARVAESGDTLEEGARKARYQFLGAVADEIKATRIATGHTTTDQAETVLMRIIRGTGIRGLAGIPTRRGRIVRPLLCLDRDQTRSYCEARGIPYVIDSTNDDATMARNRIRAELLPLLESSYNNQVEANLLRLARNAQDVLACIRTKTRPLVEQNLRQISDREWILNTARVSPLDDTSLVVLFGDIFAEALGCDMDFGRVHYEDLVKLVRDSRGSGKMVSLPGLAIKREYENVIITRPAAVVAVAPNVGCHTTLTFPGETRAAGLLVKTEILTGPSSTVRATKQTAYFAFDRLKLPLVLRSPRAGDRIQPFGMTGSKKISDIFTDKKIPGRQRVGARVVADADKILWVVGVATGEQARVTAETDRVVRITVSEE